MASLHPPAVPTLHALSGYIVPVLSEIEPVVVKAPVYIPEVGLRWGSPSSFTFEQPPPGDESNGGTTVQWWRDLDARPRREVQRFVGQIISPKYIKIRSDPEKPDSWAVKSVPRKIRFTNERKSPKDGVTKLTTIIDLIFTLHPEGETIGGPVP